ncbi:hypothetical protein RRG08_031129 [Elysia crispata]|uniref:Uncharacterized protein n=1 Tax=Elysia crispata TaxID=231223 RepID=A0AAE0ZF71_9GAST|nr:hypothetical protein RRG08_031129 [Elysia crispata]
MQYVSDVLVTVAARATCSSLPGGVESAPSVRALDTVSGAWRPIGSAVSRVYLAQVRPLQLHRLNSPSGIYQAVRTEPINSWEPPCNRLLDITCPSFYLRDHSGHCDNFKVNPLPTGTDAQKVREQRGFREERSATPLLLVEPSGQ